MTLANYGDSLLVIADEDVVKVHIHSEQPGDVLSYGQRYGNLINMKIENMRQQHTNIVGETHAALSINSIQHLKENTRIRNCYGFDGFRNCRFI